MKWSIKESCWDVSLTTRTFNSSKLTSQELVRPWTHHVRYSGNCFHITMFLHSHGNFRLVFFISNVPFLVIKTIPIHSGNGGIFRTVNNGHVNNGQTFLCLFLLFLRHIFYLFFSLFTAAHIAYGSSQTRGPIRATAEAFDAAAAYATATATPQLVTTWDL